MFEIKASTKFRCTGHVFNNSNTRFMHMAARCLKHNTDCSLYDVCWHPRSYHLSGLLSTTLFNYPAVQLDYFQLVAVKNVSHHAAY